MFNFTPLLGAQSESSASQSLLELDGGVKVLIDVGWDESFDVEKLRDLEKHVPTLSLILLTHATVSHLAAYAHCCKHFPLFTRIPVYATTPVISLGRTLLQDLYSSQPLAYTVIPTSTQSESSLAYPISSIDKNSHILLQPPTKAEIATYFSLIHPLKYSQPHQPLPSPFSPPLNGLTITAYNAGHTLGGTIWHIQHGLESIVYAVDWNQARENILAGAAWLGGAGAGGAEVIEQLRKPTALICSSKGAERVALAGGKNKRDELLLDQIKAAVSRGGTVLIPTDSSARVLELAYLIEHAYRKESQNKDSLLWGSQAYLCSRNINATMRYTRSMLEWMDENIIREFEAIAGGTDKDKNQQKNDHKNDQQKKEKGAGPFDFKHLNLLEKQEHVKSILGNVVEKDGRKMGKVILASDSSLDWGFSRICLEKMAKDPDNLIILTEKTFPLAPNIVGSAGVARTLHRWYEEREEGVVKERTSTNKPIEQVPCGGRNLVLPLITLKPLEGAELESYNQWMATQRQVQDTLAPGVPSLEAAAEAEEADSSSSSESDDSDTEDKQGRALNISIALGQAGRKKAGLSNEDMGVNVLIRRRGVHDFDVRGKKGREKMFPMVIKRRRTDEFGELIRPEEYLRAEERDEIDGSDMRQSGKYDTKDTLGKKRKWDTAGSANSRRGSSSKRRRQSSELPDQLLNDTGFVHDVFEDDVADEADDEPLGPSKAVFNKRDLKVNLRLAFVDFAGLHDKRSLQMLIPLIQPRKLILVSGLAAETAALAEDCRKLLSTGEKGTDVYTPIIGLTVDASVDTNAWAVKLSYNLVKQLRWQKVRGLAITTLTGHLKASPESEEAEQGTPSKKQKTIEGAPANEVPSQTLTKAPEEPILDPLPLTLTSRTKTSHTQQPLHVGDLRLADLRKIMLSSGYPAEFKGEGTLVVDNIVAVRKLGTGRIEVETVVGGGEGEDWVDGGRRDSVEIERVMKRRQAFYEVRRRIYEGLAVVAGVS